MSGWISVKDRLPVKNTDDYFLCFDYSDYGFHEILQGMFIHWSGNDGPWFHFTIDEDMVNKHTGCAKERNITHWMPLPEPPKMNDKKYEKLLTLCGCLKKELTNKRRGDSCYMEPETIIKKMMKTLKEIE